MCVAVLSQYGDYRLSSGGTHLVKDKFENSDSDDALELEGGLQRGIL